MSGSEDPFLGPQFDVKDKPSGLEEGFYTHRVLREGLVFLSVYASESKTFSSVFFVFVLFCLPFYRDYGSYFMCLTVWVLISARMMPSGNT